MTDEDEIIADFIGEKKAKPPAKKLIIEDTDFSDPGLQVHWLENVGGRYRVMSARIVPVPESVKDFPQDNIDNPRTVREYHQKMDENRARTPPGLTRELVLSESMPFLEKYIVACGKNVDDYILPFNKEKSRSGYIYTTMIDDITLFALKFYLNNVIDSIQKEGDEQRAKTTMPTSTGS